MRQHQENNFSIPQLAPRGSFCPISRVIFGGVLCPSQHELTQTRHMAVFSTVCATTRRVGCSVTVVTAPWRAREARATLAAPSRRPHALQHLARGHVCERVEQSDRITYAACGLSNIYVREPGRRRRRTAAQRPSPHSRMPHTGVYAAACASEYTEPKSISSSRCGDPAETIPPRQAVFILLTLKLPRTPRSRRACSAFLYESKRRGTAREAQQ